ncbi:MAG: uridylate kinase [Clostridiales bacterium]|nr:uridylate kinase [Clostridiales bacterium]MBQ2816349.1 uridylate kinase [Clostridia bacterium]
MAGYVFDLVGKIGSMALIRREDNDIDYNIFARIGAQLKPGMIWVTSGATEIGRIDYIKRTGCELTGILDEIKTDYAAQGQAILMELYRQFISPSYGIRQILVEHMHFNDHEKRDHIQKLLIRSAQQGTVPIINYNDPVSALENRKMELSKLRSSGDEDVVECVDNDETASVIAGLVHAKNLLILTSTDGIYSDPKDPSTLIREITGSDKDELEKNIRNAQKSCVGASREGAQGAKAKLEYIIKPALAGTNVIIGSPKYRIDELVGGSAPATRIRLLNR